MENKILFLLSLLFMIALIFIPFYPCNGEENVKETKNTQENTIEVTEENLDEDNISKEEQQMYDELLEISYIEDEKEWFIRYMEMNEKYPEYLTMPETIYDRFDNEEIEKLFKIVEAEATGGTFVDKVNVATTIFNRLEDERFPKELDEIITEDQFSPLKDGRFWKVEVTEDTILACEYSFIFNTKIHDALYFDSTCGKSWAHRNMSEVDVDGNNSHRFYK